MSVTPHAGIIDYGTFISPNGSIDGVQGEVPGPLASQAGYVMSTNGWVPSAGAGGSAYAIIYQQVDASNAYLGYAPPGSLTSAAVWAIEKLVFAGGGVTITWANGSASATNIWDNRASLPYS